MAQNGSYLGSDTSSPFTWPPIVTPRSPSRFDAVLELLRRQVGKLQRHRRHGHEAIRVRRHPLRQPLVLRLDDAAREVAVGGVPPVAVDAQRLHVHALAVHRGSRAGPQDVRRATAAAAFAKRRALHDLGDLGNHAVRVHVDDLDAPAADRHLPRAAAGAWPLASPPKAYMPAAAPATV